MVTRQRPVVLAELRAVPPQRVTPLEIVAEIEFLSIRHAFVARQCSADGKQLHLGLASVKIGKYMTERCRRAEVYPSSQRKCSGDLTCRMWHKRAIHGAVPFPTMFHAAMR